MPLIDELKEKIEALDYVQEFQVAEAKLRATPDVWADYEEMKRLQKEAVLFQQIGKEQAFRETSRAAQILEKKLKENVRVVDYAAKMVAVNDLLTYVTREIEEKVEAGLNG
ncbi:MAG: YlbF family regulator [Streptococcaceae bacterium]|jgi:cell fate (sporulation/competence/biofilm development) regulator YmcA (YheA/YmcA/DUF963 family)|nr:YlbF family regulator [Streptococcaceae bacterium]